MSDIKKLFGKVRARVVKAGEVLIEQGVPQGRIYILDSGELTVLRNGVEVATISNQGELVGEMAALLEMAPTATVTARSDARVYVMANPVGRLLEDPALLLHISRLLANRLAATTADLAASRKGLAASTRAGLLSQT